MKVLKKTITIKKINIDLVFCPAKKLYWEYLVCKTCHCFISNYDSYIECNFRKSEFATSKYSNNTAESSVKGILLQNFSKNAETKNSNINNLGISNSKMVIKELSYNLKRDEFRQKINNVSISTRDKLRKKQKKVPNAISSK